MLVLTRRERERLKVGDDVTVTVVGIRGNEVRLGFEAPRSVPVHREEIYERIREMSADELRRRIDQELL
jgi:carbon storage regulator